MKRILCAALLAVTLATPTFAAKLYLKDDQAIQAAVGSAFVGGGIQVHADYVFHPWMLEDRESFVLLGYVGPGVRVIDYAGGRGGENYFAVGVRAVAGLVFDFKDVPLDAFVEVAGVGEYQFGAAAAKGFEVTLNAGAGARYYF